MLQKTASPQSIAKCIRNQLYTPIKPHNCSHFELLPNLWGSSQKATLHSCKTRGKRVTCAIDFAKQLTNGKESGNNQSIDIFLWRNKFDHAERKKAIQANWISSAGKCFLTNFC